MLADLTVSLKTLIAENMHVSVLLEVWTYECQIPKYDWKPTTYDCDRNDTNGKYDYQMPKQARQSSVSSK